MLLYYSVYKVVENFCVLEGLILGRIDLGFGRVSGGMLIVLWVLNDGGKCNVDQYLQ